MQLEDKNEADVEDFEASIYIMHIGRPDMYLECVVVKLVLNKMTRFFRREKYAQQFYKILYHQETFFTYFMYSAN